MRAACKWRTAARSERPVRQRPSPPPPSLPPSLQQGVSAPFDGAGTSLLHTRSACGGLTRGCGGCRCQIAGWKSCHKKSCRATGQLSLEDIRSRVVSTHESKDFPETLRWESRIDEMVVGLDCFTARRILGAFADAYVATDQTGKAGEMWGRYAETCGEDVDVQADAMAKAASFLLGAGESKIGALWFERARDVSAQNGCLGTESNMCLSLAKAYSSTGRHTDSLEQLRRGLAGVERFLKEDSMQKKGRSKERRQQYLFVQTQILRELVDGLRMESQKELQFAALVEADALLLRLREEGGNKADCLLWNHYLGGIVHLHRQKYHEAAQGFQVTPKP